MGVKTGKRVLSKTSNRMPRIKHAKRSWLQARGAAGESGKELFIKTALDLYMETAQFAQPLLTADGEPVLDQFGRMKDAAPFAATMLSVGGVWMTKAMLRAAWKIVFNQDYYALDFPDYYAGLDDANHPDIRVRRAYLLKMERRMKAEIEPGWSNRTMPLPSYAHPMTTPLNGMITAGELLYPRRNCYMFSQAICDLHDRSVTYLEFLRRQVAYETNLAGDHHVNQSGWRGVLAKLGDYTAFDTTKVWRVAQETANAAGEPLVTGHEMPRELIRQHIGRWLKEGLLRKVTVHLYRTTSARTDEHRPHWTRRAISPLDWVDKLILRIYERQFKEAESTFTLKDVLGWFDGVVPAVTIRDRFYRHTKGDDAFFEQWGVRGHYRLTDRMMALLDHHPPVDVSALILEQVGAYSNSACVLWVTPHDVLALHPKLNAGTVMETLVSMVGDGILSICEVQPALDRLRGTGVGIRKTPRLRRRREQMSETEKLRAEAYAGAEALDADPFLQRGFYPTQKGYEVMGITDHPWPGPPVNAEASGMPARPFVPWPTPHLDRIRARWREEI